MKTKSKILFAIAILLAVAGIALLLFHPQKLIGMVVLLIATGMISFACISL